MANNNPVVKFEKANDGRIRFVPTVGVAQAVFDYIQKNSGCARTQAIATLIKQGYKKSSVTSLITQNLRAGTFKLDDEKNVFCVSKEYRPTPSAKALRKKLAKPVKAAKPVAPTKHKQSAGIAALKVDSGVLGVKVFDPKEFLNTLSVMQARSLYDELKKVFGG